MEPLEQLFVLEVEFFRRLRTEAPGTVDAGAPHTSYALRFGYERLIGAAGRVRGRDIDVLIERLTRVGDVRDVFKARDSLMQMLGIDLRDG